MRFLGFKDATTDDADGHGFKAKGDLGQGQGQRQEQEQYFVASLRPSAEWCCALRRV